MMNSAAIEAVQVAMKGTVDDVTTLILGVLPYALGLFALGFGILKAKKFTKSASN